MSVWRRRIRALQRVPVRNWLRIPWVRELVCSIVGHTASREGLWCVRCGTQQ